MPDGTKYDSTLNSLKVTEAEYQNQVIKGVRAVQEKDHIDLTRAPQRELKNEAEAYVDAHDWFQEFDGATLGAIVEFSSAEAHKLTHWQLQQSPSDVLKTLAREMMVCDILDETRDIKYQIEGDTDA